jgi:hypothetical protein
MTSDDEIVELDDDWFNEREEARLAIENKKKNKTYDLVDVKDIDDVIIRKPIKNTRERDIFRLREENEETLQKSVELRKSIRQFRKNNINPDDDESLKEYDQYVDAHMMQKRRRDLITSTPLRKVNSPMVISEVQIKAHNNTELFNLIKKEEDIDFLTPVKRCASLGPDHNPKAIAICKSIINRISMPENCINILTRWQRFRMMPNIDEEMEDKFIIAHVVFSEIKLEIMTKLGYILFDSITNIYNLIHPELYVGEEYSIPKHRFAIPSDLMADDASHRDELLLFFRSTCFYEARQTDASDNNTEVINFAHNDILHEYSGHMRSNFVYAQIYFKLRMKIGDEVEFKKTQLAFKRTLDFIISAMYAHKKYMTIPFETVECIIHLSEIITDIDMYTIMTQNIYQFYKEIDMQRRREIIELCKERLPSNKIQRVI